MKLLQIKDDANEPLFINPTHIRDVSVRDPGEVVIRMKDLKIYVMHGDILQIAKKINDALAGG